MTKHFFGNGPTLIVFETQRLLVRDLRNDDFEAFYALCRDPEINRYMADGKPLTAEQTSSWIQISQDNYQQRGYGCFVITSHLDGQLIGFGGLARPANNPVEIIYAFKQSCWGQGYGYAKNGYASCSLSLAGESTRAGVSSTS